MIVFADAAIDRPLVGCIARHLAQVIQLLVQIALNIVEALEELVGQQKQLLFIGLITPKLSDYTS